MTNGQSRVLVLLLVLVGLEALLSPTVRQVGDSLRKGQLNGAPLSTLFTQGSGGLPAPAAGLLGYSVAAVALLALAGPAPELATWIVVLLLLLVLFTHGSQVSGFITAAGNGVQALGNGAGTKPASTPTTPATRSTR